MVPSATPNLTRFAWLSIAAALATMLIKTAAYLLTNSVGLLSDALESGVNLGAAVVALAVLRVVALPPDEDHAYGHGKAEYFSSGVEGTLITFAAAAISVAAVQRLIEPRPIERLGLGLAATVGAAGINLAVALVLRRVGRQWRSITLEADSQHLMTDVWTTGGVVVGVAAASLTGWQTLDPLVALAVAANIAWSGVRLVRRSLLGLMDTAVPPGDLRAVRSVLEEFAQNEARYHALRTRQAGARTFVSFHVQVPGTWSVQRGHDLLEAMERKIRQTLAGVTVFTHLEPIEDPASFEDQTLDRMREDEEL
ncbi:MAG TPA: cation diffusion facilitator family transporter [Anaerolineales bacterium]|nr:cation diffusion facilitator family transporter [Anaerolineales bacterium]